MSLRVFALCATILSVPLHCVEAQENGVVRLNIVKSDLSTHGKEVVQVRVDFGPGVSAPNHRHPGEEVAFVLEGTIEYKLQGRETVTLKAGQALAIPAGVPHSAKNVGNDKASELATYIVEKGAPLVEPVE
jgi:quercetin dioxygenase-like cupin family protein